MTPQEMKDLTLSVMQASENVHDKDAVYGAMFSAGIPFSPIQRLYREVGIESGLIVDPTKAKEDITAFLSNLNIIEFEDYSSVVSLSAKVQEALPKVDEELILKTIRAYYKEQEVILPRATREYAPRGPRGGKVAEALVNYAHTTDPKKMSRLGMYEAIRPHLKAPKNAYEQVNTMFLVLFAVHNNLSYDSAIESVKELPLLNLTELEDNDVAPE